MVVPLCVPGGDWRDILTRVCRRGLGGADAQFLPQQQLDLLKGEDTAVTTYSLLPWSFHFHLGWGRGGAGRGLGGEKSHNLKKDYINHLLCNPFTVPGLVKNCCKHRGHSLTMQLLITVFFFLNLLIVCGTDEQERVGEEKLRIGFSQSRRRESVTPVTSGVPIGKARCSTLCACQPPPNPLAIVKLLLEHQR